MMTSVFGYIRVSGASQIKGPDDVKKDGPIRQQEAIQKFCELHGLGSPIFHSDLGVSGTVEGLDRPGFVRMLDEARIQGVEQIVVEKLERLARDLIVSEFMMRELRKRNIRLYATDQEFRDIATADLDPSRKLIRQIFSAMAEYEKSSLVLKLRVARERKKRETGRCDGTIPYGKKNRAELVILELIKNLRDSGATWGGIATLLNQNGTKKRNGKSWKDSEIASLHKRYIRKDSK